LEKTDIPKAIVFNGNFENALKRWRRIVQQNGIFKELKFRQTYPNPADRKKAKRERAARRRIRHAAKHGYQL